MFPFRPYVQNRYGQFKKAKVGLLETAKTRAGFGWDDSLLKHDIYGRAQDYFAKDSQIISANEANQEFGMPEHGLTFDRRIPIDYAVLLRERKKREVDKARYLQLVEAGAARSTVGFVSHMAGVLLNPVDAAISFVPVIGLESAAARIGGRGAIAAFRRGMARGILGTEEAMAKRGIMFPRITSSIIDGTVGNLAAEIPYALQATKNKEAYGTLDFGVNVALGGVFGGGLRAGAITIEELVRGIGRAQQLIKSVSPQTRELMDRKAIQDFLEGKDIDIADVLGLDPKVIRERVKFNAEEVRVKALKEAGLSDIEATVRAKLEGSNLERLNDTGLIALAKRVVKAADSAKRGHEPQSKTIKRLLARLQKDTGDIDAKKHLAQTLAVEYDSRGGSSPLASTSGLNGRQVLSSALFNDPRHRRIAELEDELRDLPEAIAKLDREKKLHRRGTKKRVVIESEREKLKKSAGPALKELEALRFAERANRPLIENTPEFKRAVEAETKLRADQFVEKERRKAELKAADEVWKDLGRDGDLGVLDQPARKPDANATDAELSIEKQRVADLEADVKRLGIEVPEPQPGRAIDDEDILKRATRCVVERVIA